MPPLHWNRRMPFSVSSAPSPTSGERTMSHCPPTSAESPMWRVSMNSTEARSWDACSAPAAPTFAVAAHVTAVADADRLAEEPPAAGALSGDELRGDVVQAGRALDGIPFGGDEAARVDDAHAESAP